MKYVAMRTEAVDPVDESATEMNVPDGRSWSTDGKKSIFKFNTVCCGENLKTPDRMMRGVPRPADGRTAVTISLYLLVLFSTPTLSVAGYEPTFDVPIVNVTVVTGQTAVLPCSIEYLGKHKVAWLDVKSVPLTYEDRRVVDDFRFSVVRPIVKEWNLQIRDIRYEDQGQYRCTINTLPVKSKLVTLHVKVPAAIIDNLSSNDLTVKEGENVVLVCNVTGVPKPEVTWYELRSDGERERIGQKGEMMIIRNITRHCIDVFECIASNGVPPSVSRQMKVTVEFKPEVTLPNKRLGQIKGKETILDCSIAANPQAISYWEKDGMKVSGGKYSIDAYEEGKNSIVLSLRISSVDDPDWGKYKCVASNSLGSDEATMVLYEYLQSDEVFKKASSMPSTVDAPFVTSRSFAYFPVKNPPARQGAQVFKPTHDFSIDRYSNSAFPQSLSLILFHTVVFLHV